MRPMCVPALSISGKEFRDFLVIMPGSVLPPQTNGRPQKLIDAGLPAFPTGAQRGDDVLVEA